MDYQKIAIEYTPFQEWMRDVLVAELGNIGFDSFIETEQGCEAFIPNSLYDKESLESILTNCLSGCQYNYTEEFIKDQNWNEEWEKNYFQPLLIADQCLIRAPFHTQYPKATYEIVIEPNMAFGTGNHETTSGIIESILKTDIQNKTVLDMGSGTGILGILASMKGAQKVLAIDIDEWSYSGSRENAELNGIENMEVLLGDASLLGDTTFDFIFANIHKNVLLNDLPAYEKVLRKGGTLIMSGFYTADIPEIEAKAMDLGLQPEGVVVKNDWVSSTFTKP